MSIKANSIAAIASAVLLSCGTACSILSSDESGERSEDRVSVEGLSRSNLVREGRGELQYTAASDGTLYVVNGEQENVVFQRRVERGQRIEVTPGEDRIKLDDDTVFSENLERDDEHRIYLVRSRDAERREDRNNPDVPRGVPSGAQLMGSGENKEIAFSPSRDGVVYLYDADRRQVVSQTRIEDGQKFVLSPGRGRATIEGKVVEADGIDTKTNYRVFFSRQD